MLQVDPVDPWPGDWWELSGGVVQVVDTVPRTGELVVRWYGRRNFFMGAVEMGQGRYILRSDDFVGGLPLNREGFLPGFLLSVRSDFVLAI